MTRVTLIIVVFLAASGMAYSLAVLDYGKFLVLAWITIPLIGTIFTARMVKVKSRVKAAGLYVFVFLGSFLALFFCLSQGPLAGAFVKALHISS